MAPPSSWQPWVDAGVGLLVVLTAGLTLLATFLVWRDGYRRGWWSAREAPPTCPKCGYNLSGLTQCRCPECGTEYRLDELWRTPVYTKKKRKDAAYERSESENP